MLRIIQDGIGSLNVALLEAKTQKGCNKPPLQGDTMISKQLQLVSY